MAVVRINGEYDLSDDRWNDKYPELGTEPIPIEPYISREYFALERDRIFRKVLLRDILMEDGTTLEHTQDVLASGAKSHFQLQHQEICVRHAYKVGEGYVGFYKHKA